MKAAKYLLIGVFSLIEVVAYAQPAPPPPPDLESSLDVMVLVLLAASTIFAVKSIVSVKKTASAGLSKA